MPPIPMSTVGLDNFFYRSGINFLGHSVLAVVHRRNYAHFALNVPINNFHFGNYDSRSEVTSKGIPVPCSQFPVPEPGSRSRAVGACLLEDVFLKNQKKNCSVRYQNFSVF